MAITGLTTPTNLQKILEAGANDYMAKPINFDLLNIRLEIAEKQIQNFAELKNARQELEKILKEKTTALIKTNEELIEEFVQRKEFEAKNQALLNAIPDLIFQISREGIFLEYKAARDIELYVSPRELLNKHVSEVLPSDLAEKVLHFIEKTLDTHEVQKMEYTLTIENQTKYYEARFAVCGRNDVITVIRDITQRKEVEQEIDRYRYHLEELINERTSELISVNRDLHQEIAERKQVEKALQESLKKEQELNELKSRFVSIVSHEFRTPLTTILSSSNLIKRFLHKMSDEQKIEHLNTIQDEITRLTQMLDDVLIIGKTEEGRLRYNPGPVQLKAFCEEIIEKIRKVDDARHRIEFLYQTQYEIVIFDPKLMRHVFSNLLFNAVKYSPPHTNVHFIVTDQKDYLVFECRDEGIGISEEEQKRLFEPFHRANNVSTISGTGLGLSIVKQYVELHRGKISVNSEINHGTTFTVSIPIIQPDEGV